MNPLTNIRNITKLNELEARYNVPLQASWHRQYKDSAYIFIGGLPYDLCEGDIICVFSQFGEIIDINLVRDGKTGKSKGFCFLCYEDQRSTILAVDNFNGMKLLGRTLKVDHVSDYRRPKEHDDDDAVTQMLRKQGVMPRVDTEPGEPTKEDTRKKQKEIHTSSRVTTSREDMDLWNVKIKTEGGSTAKVKRSRKGEGKRSMSKEKERKQSRSRERNMSNEKERKKLREKERNRSREERNSTRETEMKMSRETERKRSREKERNRSREKERKRSRERKSSREKERKRSRERKSSREKERKSLNKREEDKRRSRSREIYEKKRRKL